MEKAQWLMGSRVGLQGPWGTTYATNLRLRIAAMDEAEWLKYTANLHTRPLDAGLQCPRHERGRSPRDLPFHQSLGPAGEPAPAYLPPGKKPPLPYFEFVLPPAVPPKG